MSHLNVSYKDDAIISGLIANGVDFQALAETGHASVTNITQSGEGVVRFKVEIETLWVPQADAKKILGDALS